MLNEILLDPEYQVAYSERVMMAKILRTRFQASGSVTVVMVDLD